MNLASMQQGIKKLQWFEYLKSGISRNIKYAIMLGFCKSGHIAMLGKVWFLL